MNFLERLKTYAFDSPGCDNTARSRHVGTRQKSLLKLLQPKLRMKLEIDTQPASERVHAK